MSVQKLRNRRIFSVVREIPRGRVATYGQVAEIAGYPGRARHVGFALANYDGDEELPWHRVLNAQGRVSVREDSELEEVQRDLLREEGVVFSSSGRLDLDKYRW